MEWEQRAWQGCKYCNALEKQETIAKGEGGWRVEGCVWYVRWAKNGNCIDVITCAANYLLKSINQRDRQAVGGRTTGRMNWQRHPASTRRRSRKRSRRGRVQLQLLFYASFRWQQQIIVMFLRIILQFAARCWAISSMLLIRPVCQRTSCKWAQWLRP